MQVQITKEILELIRNFAYKEDISLSEFARRTNISKAWLSRLKNHDANLSLETATYLLDVIGYKLIIQKENTKTNKSRLKKVVTCQNM